MRPPNDGLGALLTELGLTKAELLANRPLLTAVLRYHVLGSKVLKAQIQPGKAITAKRWRHLQGGHGRQRTRHHRRAQSHGADHGHRHRRVQRRGARHRQGLLPADKTIVQTAQALAAGTPAEFGVLVEAVVAADLAGTLSGTGPFTVFAPTDAAFVAALAELGLTKRSCWPTSLC